jgi:hypothetical protein
VELYKKSLSFILAFIQKKNTNKKLVFDKSVRNELKWQRNGNNKFLKFNESVTILAIIVRNVKEWIHTETSHLSEYPIARNFRRIHF